MSNDPSKDSSSIENERVDRAITLLREASVPPGPPAEVVNSLVATLKARTNATSRLNVIGRLGAMRPFTKRVATVAALAAAACVLIGLAVWLISSAGPNGAGTRRKQGPGVGVISTPHPVATMTDRPQADWAAYCRALQSPEALDRMLTRDAARLQPEKNPAGQNVRRFFMDLLEENRNENHSMRGRGVGPVV